MTFSDKLIALRKKAGWSQEELAERLNVSRQSVSKWESAQSMPDIDKILQLSSLFSVTTDCLFKRHAGRHAACRGTDALSPAPGDAGAGGGLPDQAQATRRRWRWRRRSASSAPFRCWRGYSE